MLEKELFNVTYCNSMPLGVRRACYGNVSVNSSASLKVHEAVCVFGDPAIMSPCLFKGARFPSVLAKPCLSYCKLWPYLIRWCFIKHAVLPLQVWHCISIYAMRVCVFILIYY